MANKMMDRIVQCMNKNEFVMEGSGLLIITKTQEITIKRDGHMMTKPRDKNWASGHTSHLKINNINWDWLEQKAAAIKLRK